MFQTYYRNDKHIWNLAFISSQIIYPHTSGAAFLSPFPFFFFSSFDTIIKKSDLSRVQKRTNMALNSISLIGEGKQEDFYIIKMMKTKHLIGQLI
jgi:hypothetical protein